MEFTITRDSVHAGDDELNHRTITIKPKSSKGLNELVAFLISKKFFAQIHGGKATWVLCGSKPLCVIAQQLQEPLLLPGADIIFRKNMESNYHIKYERQLDPHKIYNKLLESNC